MTNKPLEIFYSYAHEDEGLRLELDKQLTALKRQGLISGWHDRLISAGSEWAQQIDSHLNSADIVLLLVSSDFLASDYCYSKEMMQALTRHKAGQARVIPIILRSVFWKGTPFEKLQVLPKNGKAVTSSHWQDRDEAWFDVVQGIYIAVEEMSSKSTHSPLAYGTIVQQDIGDIHVHDPIAIPEPTPLPTRFLTMTPEELIQRYAGEKGNLLELQTEAIAWTLPQVVVFDNSRTHLPMASISVQPDKVHPEYLIPMKIEGKSEEILKEISDQFHDSTTIRLNGIRQKGNSLTLIVSKAHYLQYIGTNYAMDALLKEKGWTRSLREIVHPTDTLCRLEESLLANHIGIGVLVFTVDNYLVIPIRSKEKVGIWRQEISPSISGATSYDDDMYGIKSKAGPISSWMREGREELGIENSDFDSDSDIFLGITRELLRGGKPEMFFATQLHLTKAKLEQKFNRAKDKWENKELQWLEFKNPLTPPTTEQERTQLLQEFLRLLDQYKHLLSPPARANLVLWFKYMWNSHNPGR
jgi:hypothetical protein